MPTFIAPGLHVFNHAQASASATWTIVHNLGRKPVSDILVDFEGSLQKILPLYFTYPDDNTMVVTFASAHTGVARLS